MRFLTILFSILILLVIAGVGYIALTDVTIQQENVTKSLPTENFIQ
jgi:hypothetical protein